MRLRRLDLSRYGKFTDHSIDFGRAESGQPDLHIIYGLNEAGKSTTFSAYLDLLFGIGERSPYSFLHAYNAMRIGGCLEIDGKEHELVRLKVRNGSLVDDRGQPVNEALLAGALGGIGRDAYRTMFSLDDQSLKEGGNAIIQSKGELGELLFSASSGLAGLSRALVTCAEEASGLYKKRSSTTKLAEAKRALETLKNERSAIDTLASSYGLLKASHDQANSAYETVNRELASAKIRHQECQRILNAQIPALELKRLTVEIAAMGELPPSPAEWFTLLPQLLKDETRLQALIDTTDRTILQLQEEVAAITVDETALTLGDQIERLEKARARYLAAEDDLPKRRLALAEQDLLLASLLTDLERSGHQAPEELLLPTALIGTLRDLIERRSGVEIALQAARREVRRVVEDLDRLEGECRKPEQGLVPDAASARRIEAALTRLNSSDLATRISFEERALAQAEHGLENALAALRPWHGTPDALLTTPHASARQIEAWRLQAIQLEKQKEDHQQRLRDLCTELTLTKAKIEALQANGPIGDDEAIELRRKRDEAWETHLSRLEKATAEAFEATLRQDDAYSAERLSRAQELAELRHLQKTASVTKVAIARSETLLSETLKAVDGLIGKIRPALPESWEQDGDVSELVTALEAWSLRREKALAAWEDLRQRADSLAGLQDELKTLTVELEQSLHAAGVEATVDAGVSALLRCANEILETFKRQEFKELQRQKTLAEVKRDLVDRQRDLNEAEEDKMAWDREWREALSRTWFADSHVSTAAVRSILNALSNLPVILKDHQDLLARVAAMERDQRQFGEHLAELQASSFKEASRGDPLSLAQALVDRHEQARRAFELRSSRQADLDKQWERRRALEKELLIHNARKDELTGHFGTDSLAEVELYLQKAKDRERLDERVLSLRHQIADTLRVSEFDEARQRLEDADLDAVEREAAELEGRLEDLTEKARQLYSERSAAWQKLEAVGGDDAVARIEARRRTLLLEIEDMAIRHLKLRVGVLAAEQALHLYREMHRSSMMKRASEAFRLITGGNYSGLTTQPDKDKEILIGVAREGGSKLADAMSTGTQFQLYLALRLAGYEEFAKLRPPVPFVADDIMESFDDPRSREVFRLLGDMAGVGQVIYLTHHRHLCEIAKDVVPSVKIHQLP
ncbi:AAA family ATPase (plasmid) [Peteryoungia desertarenae]|uniref:AAA family ATPase n=1 Tax=Peteryoungia desertarenae TaxID=1813451 RepID=A0ABX6QSG5_9HYPH|nr:AAA family ATPase [Peteryoungia desertarenae]QLF71480.1 AAA family ATPase [Peteryoungia desertarenae]